MQWLLMLIRSNTLEDHIHITLIHLRYLRNLPAAVLKIDARKTDVVRMDEVADAVWCVRQEGGGVITCIAHTSQNTKRPRVDCNSAPTLLAQKILMQASWGQENGAPAPLRGGTLYGEKGTWKVNDRLSVPDVFTMAVRRGPLLVGTSALPFHVPDCLLPLPLPGVACAPSCHQHALLVVLRLAGSGGPWCGRPKNQVQPEKIHSQGRRAAEN